VPIGSVADATHVERVCAWGARDGTSSISRTCGRTAACSHGRTIRTRMSRTPDSFGRLWPTVFAFDFTPFPFA